MGGLKTLAWTAAVMIAVAFVALAAVAAVNDAGQRQPYPPLESLRISHLQYVLDFGQIGPVTAPEYASLAARMTQADGPPPSVGFQYYRGGMLWFRFVAPTLGTTETNWNIRLDDPRVQIARLILVDDNFREVTWRRNDPSSLAGRALREPVFRFQRSEIEGKTILIGFTALAALRANVLVETDQATDALLYQDTALHSLLVGGLIAVALYLLVIGFRLRAPSLVAAAGMMTWIALFLYGSFGYLRSFLLSGFPSLADGLLYGTEPLLVSFILLTISNYLDLGRIAPKLNVLLVTIALLGPLQGLMEFATTIGLPVPLLIDFFPVVIVGTLAGLGVLIWVAFIRRETKARYFLLGISPIAIGGILRVYSYLNPVSSEFMKTLDSSVDVVASMMLLGLLTVFDLQQRQQKLRQQAEQNERRFRGYAELASDSYFEIDSTGSVLSAAGRLVRAIGLADGMNLADTLAAAATPEQGSELAQLRQATIRATPLRGAELALVLPGEPQKWISLNISPLGANGHLRGTMTDITERVERRNREARDATLSALGQLASGVAHEVNNLLHPIVNLARRVRDRQTDPDSQRLLDLVVASAQHAGEIVASVLNAFNPANAQASKAPIELALEDAIAAIEPTLPTTVLVHKQIGEGLGLLVVPGELLQVVSNVVSNSIRAMEGSGEITIVLEPVSDAILRLRISDTGPGMTEELRKRAFEPFVSGRSSGTGLGLSLVANIVRRWGGEVAIDSKLGKGTTIVIDLRATKDTANQ